MSKAPVVSWDILRAQTSARIGLARTGDTMSGAHVRQFRHAHLRARHAVSMVMEVSRLGLDRPWMEVESAARDRDEFVRRPDLGRQLCADSRARLVQAGHDRAVSGPDAYGPGRFYDIVFVIADGLSARAAERQAAGVLSGVLPLLTGWRIAPLVVAHRARVALGDEIATCLNACSVVMMIGERPGLECAESLSLYMTWNPHPGMRDSARNCISNIHGQGGQSPVTAANRLAWLLKNARQCGYSGINLKDETCLIEGGVSYALLGKG
ncbi:ethanolamine ammonia-lyase subunit EutC [Novacetimonas hansenii]|uniref:Ethanolamine ammonia-lyase small subunit n=2 Tax=Novacetimonas hansenii TaxID=436 RepID=A0ABQ0SDQ3_NOVHA|nr:ethanolamine ammonia-lyase subunit EutC [Novacetimonas hansenii]EFG84405.1 Ethanolamine ammonia-lyase [Novacetimonas hansenii ATCC 23769]GAN85236.1 ethanolamine ammonia lyase small subunit [Novacetimonas hansenii JCM 7643]GBQ56614.1 ethanolamine ammonia-lyase small subunit [Novacetimonas hansenii NRIC 0243]GEC63358.1 ethanolamine ammonia-lyase light chain [Novacetimonas hansenii]